MKLLKIACAIALLFGVSFAKNNGSNVLTKGKYLLSYEEEFDDVWVRKNAKSTKTKCSTRVDVNHLLVAVGDCDVERIAFYTKDSMWLGNVTHGLYNNESSYDANYSYRDVSYAFNVKDAAFMQVSFKFERKSVDEDNLWQVSCPKGYTSGFDEIGFGICYKPFQCEKNEFSLDVKTCAKLPKNGKRLPEEGWSCLDGYELFDGQDTVYCYKPFVCAKDEYSIDEQTCAKLPVHAKRLQEEGFECVAGYAKIETEDSIYCEKKAKCNASDLFVERENKCYALPAHAFWREGASDSTEFDCDEDYKLNEDGACLQRVTSCDSNSVVSYDEFSCKEIPADSHKDDEYHWSCNDGFGEKNGECFQKASCDDSEYYVDEFNCSPLPSNSHATGHGWECNDGYYSNSYWCLAVPANAHKNKYDNGWDCNYGYQEDNGSCKKLVECNSNQYKVDDFTCDELPAHAHEIYGNSWECDDGYVNTSYNVCEEIPNCGDNEVLNKDYNRCDKIPSHAEKVSEESWWCKKGYHTEYEGGESYCKSDPLDIYNNLSLEIAGNLGTQMLSSSGYSYSYIEVEDPVFIEGEIGVEWLFGEKVSFGPAISIARVYENRPDELSYYSTRLNLAAILAFGSGSIYYYGRPFISTNLGTTVEYKSEYNASAEYSVPAAVGGIELGVRLGDSYNKNWAFDLYLGFMANPFKDVWVEDEWVIYMGARLVAF